MFQFQSLSLHPLLGTTVRVASAWIGLAIPLSAEQEMRVLLSPDWTESMRRVERPEDEEMILYLEILLDYTFSFHFIFRIFSIRM